MIAPDDLKFVQFFCKDRSIMDQKMYLNAGTNKGS